MGALVRCDRCGERTKNGYILHLSNGRKEFTCEPCLASEAVDLILLRKRYAEITTRKAQKPLPDQEEARAQLIWDMRHGQKMLVREISRALKISHWAVGRYLKRA